MPDGDKDTLNWHDKIVLFLIIGVYVLFGVGILGGIVLLAWYSPQTLLAIIGAIILFLFAGALWEGLQELRSFPESWPNWLRWLLLLPLAAISVIFMVFVFSIMIQHVKTELNLSGLFYLPLVTIVTAFCAFVSGAVFIVSGTWIAPRFRIAVATSLSLIAVGVDFVLTSGVGASPYSLVIAGALVVGVIAGWKYAGDDGFFN